MTHDREFDQSDQFLQRRELLTSASMAAAGVLLTGPILGIASAEIALAQTAIAKAAQSKQKVFMVKYAGAFVTALNNAFSYDRLYKSDGTPDRTPDSTIGKFLAKYPTPGSYDESKFGTFASAVLKESDWFDMNNNPINPSTYESHDATNIYGPIKRELAARLDANLRAANPMPVWLFVGSSEMTGAQDAMGQKGYRLISATGKIGNVDHIIMGVLCPTDE